MTEATNPLIAKLSLRDVLSEEERKVLSGACKKVKEFRRGQVLVQQGSRPADCTLMLDGWSGRVRTLKTGSQQITAFHVAGDFVDLHGFLLKSMDHSIVALSACRASLVPHGIISEITQRYPHLTRMLWLSTVVDSAIHREGISVLGQRTALGRVAHLLCEVCLRLRVTGRSNENEFAFPLRQTDIGNAVGLSAVHVNRVIQGLRRKGLITWRSGSVKIERWEQLVEIAEFDPAYLNLIFEPR